MYCIFAVKGNHQIFNHYARFVYLVTCESLTNVNLCSWRKMQCGKAAVQSEEPNAVIHSESVHRFRCQLEATTLHLLFQMFC